MDRHDDCEICTNCAVKLSFEHQINESNYVEEDVALNDIVNEEMYLIVKNSI